MVMLGWKAGPEQYPPVELMEYAVAAEQAGFDALDVSDHFQPWDPRGQACFSWTWLGAVAVRTKTMQLGTGVTCPCIRYHPAIIAQASATLACFAPGRTYLAVGTGEALNEYAATGFWPDYSERRHRLSEAIELIRQLWTGEEVTFLGDFYETRKARLYTPPPQPIPLFVSAMVPESAPFAGAHGDGLFTVGGKPIDTYHKLLQRFEEGARGAKRDPDQMPRSIELNVAYTDNPEAAIEAQKQYWAGSFVPALFDQKIYTPQMSAENGQVVGADTIKQMACISADPDDHVRFAQQFIDAGFDRLFFHSAGPDQRGFLERYGRDVLPRIRQQAASRTAQRQAAD